MGGRVIIHFVQFFLSLLRFLRVVFLMRLLNAILDQIKRVGWVGGWLSGITRIELNEDYGNRNLNGGKNELKWKLVGAYCSRAMHIP